ncbi:unnamed protein product [Meloidogyne enterolobii]|uniref:Uncharacterized protein n=2 Tax=Meloidogyne enterolobii TaxID=390850 RepID=A0ACB0YZ80_MELEN|nr:unnamed protein product [Meloidogyne enterolobii]
MSCKYVNFVEIKNKWSNIDNYWRCCDNVCINTFEPIGKCLNGNGYVNLISDENIKYIYYKGGLHRRNESGSVTAENSFKKLQNCSNYLYYFEVKSKFEGMSNKDEKSICIGLRNSISDKSIYYFAMPAKISNENYEKFKLPALSWNNNDIFGCGLVYPPNNKLNEEFPYVFFTQNGKQIGKGILLKDNFASYKPFVELICCSIEANFGSDLELKPFKYDISKHLILKEFY